MNSINPARNLIERAVLVLGSIAILAGCASIPDATDSGGFSADDEAVYFARFNKLAEGGSGGAGLGSYDPLEPVAGATVLQPIPTAANALLSAEIVATARAYAAQRNSSAFIIWHDGSIVEESYFGAVKADTPLVSKSLAKPISAILIGRAIAQGHIRSLDQPVADFITEWRGDPLREKILVRHLLDMRSGFLPQALATDPGDVLNRAYLHPRHDEVIIEEMPVVNEPGGRYEYANAASEMVAPVIERATGVRYGEYLGSALLAPLGAAGGEIWVNRPGGTAHSGCCVLLPARTYLSLGILLLNDGVWNGDRLLPEGYVSAMRTGTHENPYYGLGLWLPDTYIERRGFAHPTVPFGKVLHSEPYLDKDLFLFDGNGNQVVYMIPSEDLIVLRMGDRPSQDDEWDNAFLPNLLIRDANRAPGESYPEPQPQ